MKKETWEEPIVEFMRNNRYNYNRNVSRERLLEIVSQVRDDAKKEERGRIIEKILDIFNQECSPELKKASWRIFAQKMIEDFNDLISKLEKK